MNMEEQLPRLLSINIIITSYNRVKFLEKTIESICNNTIHPYKIFVVDSNSTDGTVQYLKNTKVLGKIFDHLFLSSNGGQSMALNHAFRFMQQWEGRRPSDDIFITTNDDITCPKITPCWLSQMKHLFEKYEESHVIGGIAMRIEREARTELNDNEDLIRLYKGFPSVFRMMRRSDFDKLGDFPFQKLKHWDSNSMGTTMDTQLKKRYYLTSKIYASHFGFEVENKGYDEFNKTYLTYPGEVKLDVYKEKPYPIIQPRTNIPLKVNHPCDSFEQEERERYWDETLGRQTEEESKNNKDLRELLKKYVNGVTLDLGCGYEKVSPECIGVDAFCYDDIDILHDMTDLWFYKDGEIDTIISCNALDHVSDIKKTLKEWDRVLKSGGKMVIIVPNYNQHHSLILEKSHKFPFTVDILEILFKGLNYHIEEISDDSQRSIMIVVQKR